MCEISYNDEFGKYNRMMVILEQMGCSGWQFSGWSQGFRVDHKIFELII